ncbi:MAG: response regulator transcription factor [Methylocapsa sp.]|nr:response regulator transcription factor [Methylocapsa sp.]
MSKGRVLVVDDEPQIQRFLRPALSACGFEVLAAGTGREALRLIASAAPDAVVLDLGLPDMDGKEVLREARSFSKVPVIVLSARDREAEKIAAFDSGADDYVEKPFGIGELMARLRTALRHAGQRGAGITHFRSGSLAVDFDRRLVTCHGEAIKLTPKEFELLAALARHAGRVLTHRQILAAIWGPAHENDTQYLRVFVGHLRAKIEDDPAAPKLIQTEPGIGYRLTASE